MNISEWNQQQTTIGHLKAHYSGAQEELNRTVLRLRVERLLSNIDLHPPGLSSGAILIVRRLDSPAAVGLSVSTQAAGVNLQEFLRSQVAALYAAAARPAHSVVPLNASSVLFADPGEMLTCLTRDLLNRQAGEHWYWQQVLRDMPRTPGAALPVLWCEQASYVPTVLASLRPAEVLSAIAQLTPLAVKQVIGALHERFELPPEMFTAITRSKPGELSGTRAVQDAHRVVGGSAVSEQVVRDAAPWEQWLPNAQMPDLLPEARYLLGLGLTLYSAPAFARSTRFAAQAVRWLQAAYERRDYTNLIYESKRSPQPLEKRLETGEQTLSPAKQDGAGLQVVPLAREGEQRRMRVDDTDASHKAKRSATLPVEEERSPVASASSNDDIPLAAKLEPSSSSAGPDGRGERVPAKSQGPAISAEPELIQEESRRLEAGVSTELPESFHKIQPSDSQAAACRVRIYPARPVAPAAPGETKTREFEFCASKALPVGGVVTHLGGVLYLINLLTWLNLPHSWDDDGKFAEQISGWAIVEALAHGLLGSLHEQYRHDPIWQVLALLDGREPGQPVAAGGMALEEDRSFRLPVGWLRRFGAAAMWSAFQQDERLLLYDDAAGFLVADVPLRGRTLFEAAHAEVAAYSDAGLDVSWHIGNPVRTPFMASGWATFTTPTGQWEKNWLSAYMSEEVLWWLGRVMGFVYCVLERALGERFGDVTQLAELLLCQHGQLVVSRTHVDLYMSMEEIRIAVRRAGLDRDPGWVPDLARIVYLHFE